MKKKIYLGAGKDHRDGFVNVDSYPFPGIDIVADVTKGIPELEDSCADYVYTQDFMEHLPPEGAVPVINEIWRLLCDGGIMEHYIPNAGSRNDFGSPSHLSHWNLQVFDHFNLESHRYKLDHDYEGFIGGFLPVTYELVNWQVEEDGINRAQSIHVVMKCVKSS